MLDCSESGERCAAGEGEVACASQPTFSEVFSATGTAQASNAGDRDQFGTLLALSGDTLVVSVTGEAGSVGGINGPQDNDANESGAVYVFHNSEAGGWQQEAYVKASNPGGSDLFGIGIAVDSDLLVVGAPREDSASVGVGGEQDDNGARDSGAVYVFRRVEGVWQQEAYLKASNTERDDSFGWSVAVSGDIIVVGAPGESSATSDQANNEAAESGAAYVFRHCGGNWTQQAYLKASNAGSEDFFGRSVTISGNTIAVGASGEASRSTGIGADSSDNSLPNAGAAYIYERNGHSWEEVAYVKPSDTSSGQHFAAQLSLEADTLVATAIGESYRSGAVYVFERSGGQWAEGARLEAIGSRLDDGFGSSVSLSGDYLAVGAQLESSDASGVDGEIGLDSLDQSGAAYLFAREDGEWQQIRYIKAEDPQEDVYFGASVAVEGSHFAIGAPGYFSAFPKKARTGTAYVYE